MTALPRRARADRVCASSAQARAAWTRDGAKVFAGKPINCALEPTECVKYGAAKFTVREVE